MVSPRGQKVVMGIPSQIVSDPDGDAARLAREVRPSGVSVIIGQAACLLQGNERDAVGVQHGKRLGPGFQPGPQPGIGHAGYRLIRRILGIPDAPVGGEPEVPVRMEHGAHAIENGLKPNDLFSLITSLQMGV